MRKGIIASLFTSLVISSCSKRYTPEEISNSYCECIELLEVKKIPCVKDWAVKYKGSLRTKEARKAVNYNMIECNGFEGDNDFYLKLMRN